MQDLSKTLRLQYEGLDQANLELQDRGIAEAGMTGFMSHPSSKNWEVGLVDY